MVHSGLWRRVSKKKGQPSLHKGYDFNPTLSHNYSQVVCKLDVFLCSSVKKFRIYPIRTKTI